MDLPQLRRNLAARRIEAEEQGASPAGVEAAREGAHVAMAIAVKTGAASYLDGARELLRAASAHRAVVGACDAMLDLARLEAGPGEDVLAARGQLAELHKRFDEAGSVHDVGACLGDAKRLLLSLAEAQDGAVEHGVDIAGWAGADGAGKGGATLERVAVLGRAGAAAAASDEVRVVLYFDRVAIYRRGERPASEGQPRRLFLDLDGASLGPTVSALTTVDRGGLKRVRVVPLGAKTLRVSMDVEDSAIHRMFFLPRPFRVVMDFRPSAPVKRAGHGRVIVLDPGHGGRNPGAKGPTGLRESDVALSIARRVRHSLRRMLPDADVIMTRDDDHDVSLEERAAIANAVRADLFVSIHLNASHSAEDRGGVSTFVLDTTNDAAALRLAARENGGLEQDVTDLQVILASLYRDDQVARSTALAQAVQDETLRGGRTVLPQLESRGVKRALFYVLVGATMPAILVEASFITRPDEEEALRTDAYRAALADGIARGVAKNLRSR